LVASAAQEPGAEVIMAHLTRDIVRLPTGKALTVAEFSSSGVTIWQIQRDGTGTPRVLRRLNDWHTLRSSGAVDGIALLDRIRTENDGAVILARTGRAPASEADQDDLDADRGFEIARDAYRGAASFRSAIAVDDLLDEATARVPLPASQWYELVLLRRTPSGRLEFTAQQIFLPEARRGDSRQFVVRCEPSNDNGTVFAVVARDAAFEFKLVSMASAKVPPGTYQLTATLLRPGRVRFDGLPVKLHADPRNWLDVLAELPDRLDVYGPAHLIVAIETCGTVEEFEARVDLAEQLVTDVQAAADGPVIFSVLAYATHTHSRMMGDEPVNTLAWLESNPLALAPRLHTLRARRRVQEQELEETLAKTRSKRAVQAYAQPPRAAQIECMLAEVARRLREQEAAAAGRPVLVTIGARSAFPYRLDRTSEIIPCPRRLDWRTIWRQLVHDHAGMAFGVIRDGWDDQDTLEETSADEIWRHLGTDMITSADAFSAHAFAVGLGLVPPTLQYLPFPLAIERVD
jgi:hypothetical protein